MKNRLMEEGRNEVDFLQWLGIITTTKVRMVQNKEAVMLKLEIKMDENKILDERKYKVESIYRTLEQAFFRYKLKSMQEPDMV